MRSRFFRVKPKSEARRSNGRITVTVTTEYAQDVERQDHLDPVIASHVGQTSLWPRVAEAADALGDRGERRSEVDCSRTIYIANHLTDEEIIVKNRDHEQRH